MKLVRAFLTDALIGGLLVVVPIYLAVLVLLKGMQSVAALVQPIAAIIPSWLPAENLLSAAVVLLGCFFVGVTIRTRAGGAPRRCSSRQRGRMLSRTRERAPGPTSASTRRMLVSRAVPMWRRPAH